MRIVAVVDGNEVEVNLGNPITSLSRDLGRRQLADLLEHAVGQVARAHRLDFTVSLSASAERSEKPDNAP